MNSLTEQIQALESFIYSPLVVPLMLVLVGGLVTLATGFVQIRRFPTAVRMALRGALGRNSSGGDGTGTITQFQALSTALASTVGNGNIGGVATAILIGGPGAIFWMWVTAAVGGSTS